MGAASNSKDVHMKQTLMIGVKANDDLLQECAAKSQQLLTILQSLNSTSNGQSFKNLLTLAGRIHETQQSLVSLQSTSPASSPPNLLLKNCPMHHPVLEPPPGESLPSGHAASTSDQLFHGIPCVLKTTFRPRGQILGVPRAILDAYFRNPGTKYSPRYQPQSGHLALHANSYNRLVLSHHLLPPRALDPAVKSLYIATLERLQSFSLAAPGLIKALLDCGFGVPQPQSWLAKHVVTSRNASNPARVIAQACTRPYVVVCMTDRDALPDWWEALLGVRDVLNFEVPVHAKLALLVGIELHGFEEPTTDVHLPPESERMYSLRERIAIVVSNRRAPQQSRRPSSKQGKRSGCMALSSEDDDLSSLDELDSHSDMDQSGSTPNERPERAQDPSPPPLAIPTCLYERFPKHSKPPKPRYSATGHLHVHNYALPALAHMLVTARDLPAQVTTKYVSAVTASIHKDGLLRNVFSFAVKRGPTRPFGLKDVARPRSLNEVRNTVLQLVARPVVLVDFLDKIEYYGVWERLMRRVVNTWWGQDGGYERQEQELHRARLVMLVGLEVVGYEKPVATNQVPPLNECQFVIRERFALVPGDPVRPTEDDSVKDRIEQHPGSHLQAQYKDGADDMDTDE